MSDFSDAVANAQRLAWLIKRVDYLEHRNAQDVPAADQPESSGFWYRGITSGNWDDTCLASTFCPDCADSDLVEYIDKMLLIEQEATRNEP
jgi:hypothetical protein